MNELHAIYRWSGPSSWDAYSYPVSISVGGLSLEHVRDQFRAAARFHFGDDWSDVEIVEHLEEPLSEVEGVFVRTALDRQLLDRQQVVEALRGVLKVPEWVAEFEETALIAATGDVVVVACLTTDRVTWVVEQMGEHDSLQVCLPISDHRGVGVWMSRLSAPEAEGIVIEQSETLEEAGLSNDWATMADFARADRRQLVTA